MRISGEWFPCDDGFVRPVVGGEILNAHGQWEPTLFLVDTGADCTVFSAAILDVLGFDVSQTQRQLGGVGGVSPSVEISTRIRLPHDRGGTAIFRGQSAAMTRLEALDMSILGRDILNLFSVIVDRQGDVDELIRPPHRYVVETA